jgi:drug/metabolite transporter (DMT)-like permease
MVPSCRRYLLSSGQLEQPIFLTLCHMVSSSLVPIIASIMPAAAATPSRPDRKHRQQPEVTVTQLAHLVLLAAVFCTSVVLGNLALRFIPISFYQAINATTPAFTAGLAFLILGRRECTTVYLTLLPVTIGLVIATGESLLLASELVLQ